MDIKKYHFKEFSRDNIINQEALSEDEFEKRIKVFNEIFSAGLEVDNKSFKPYVKPVDIVDNEAAPIEEQKETIGSMIDISSILPKKSVVSVKVPEKNYEDGFKEGYERAKQENDLLYNEMIAEQNTLIKMMMEKINYLGGEIIDKAIKDLAVEMVDLIIEISTKIAGTMLKKEYINIIQSEVENVLSKLITSQNVIIELNPQTSVKMRPLLMSQYENHTFKIEIVDNKELEVYDCKVSWVDGAFEFIKKNREIMLKDILQRLIPRVRK